MPTLRAGASQPLYRRVKAMLLARIRSGEWAEGAEVPSENRLVVELGVSRMTVHKALRELAEEGLLTRLQGVGTFVAESLPGMEIVHLGQIADEIAARGGTHSARVLRLVRAYPPPEIMRQFHLVAGTDLFHSVILHCENGVPLQHEDRWVNPLSAPDYLAQDFAHLTTTRYLLQREPNPSVEHLVEAVRPVADVAALLGIAADEPCLRLLRRTWASGRVVTVAALTHPGTRFRLGTRFQAMAQPAPSALAI